MSNKKKNETLGMPHGTAAGKLRKNILFHLLKKHNENVCIRCDELICSVDELSIEHLKPWEGISAELFWDLNNIAFSHMKCNRPHKCRGGKPRRVCPEGTSYCGGHKQFLSKDLFYKHSAEWNGVDFLCKECNDIKRGRKQFLRAPGVTVASPSPKR